MDWIADIFKNLEAKKSLVGVVFLTAFFLYFGPTHAPDIIPKPPPELTQFVFPTMLFTGLFILYWTVVKLWNVASIFMRYNILTFCLSEHEKALLLYMARSSTGQINIELIYYSNIPWTWTKLETYIAAKKLRDKGLAGIWLRSTEVVWLTDLGQRMALKIQKNSKPPAVPS